MGRHEQDDSFNAVQHKFIILDIGWVVQPRFVLFYSPSYEWGRISCFLISKKAFGCRSCHCFQLLVQEIYATLADQFETTSYAKHKIRVRVVYSRKYQILGSVPTFPYILSSLRSAFVTYQ